MIVGENASEGFEVQRDEVILQVVHSLLNTPMDLWEVKK